MPRLATMLVPLLAGATVLTLPSPGLAAAPAAGAAVVRAAATATVPLILTATTVTVLHDDGTTVFARVRVRNARTGRPLPGVPVLLDCVFYSGRDSFVGPAGQAAGKTAPSGSVVLRVRHGSAAGGAFTIEAMTDSTRATRIRRSSSGERPLRSPSR